jgi:hypothetical protein
VPNGACSNTTATCAQFAFLSGCFAGRDSARDHHRVICGQVHGCGPHAEFGGDGSAKGSRKAEKQKNQSERFKFRIPNFEVRIVHFHLGGYNAGRSLCQGVDCS